MGGGAQNRGKMIPSSAATQLMVPMNNIRSQRVGLSGSDQATASGLCSCLHPGLGAQWAEGHWLHRGQDQKLEGAKAFTHGPMSPALFVTSFLIVAAGGWGWVLSVRTETKANSSSPRLTPIISAPLGAIALICHILKAMSAVSQTFPRQLDVNTFPTVFSNIHVQTWGVWASDFCCLLRMGGTFDFQKFNNVYGFACRKSLSCAGFF